MADVEIILKHYEHLKQLRTDFEKAWEECREYAMPYAPSIYGGTHSQSNRPGTVNIKNFDSATEIALKNLASVLLSNTTSPTSRWVQFKSPDEAKQDVADIVEDSVSEAFEDSNAYAELFSFFKNEAGYGTSALYIGECNTGADMYFKTLHIGDIVIAEDYMGEVDTLFRETLISLRELVQMFGEESLSDSAKKLYEKNPYDEITVVHGVLPRVDSDREMTDEGEYKTEPLSLPYAEFWIEKEKRHLIIESGYRTFPFMVGRWEKEPGRVYGHGPVMDALADIKQLNRAERSKIEIAEKLNNPPKLFIGGEPDDWDTTPGAKNVIDDPNAQMVDIVTAANFPITANEVHDKRMAVREALYANQIQGMDRRNEKDMTAREVYAIEQEGLRILGPVSHRNQKMIEKGLMRVLDILEKHGKLPKEADIFTLKFVNSISRAQKSDEINAVNYLIAAIQQLGTLNRETLYKWNFDVIADKIFDATGLPMTMKNKKGVIEALKAQASEQAQKGEQIQMAVIDADIKETQAKTAEKLSRAQKNNQELSVV